MNEYMTIDDFNQENRNILEQGVNLLRYGLKEDEIDGFIDACINNTNMAKFINHKMDIWGPGLGYEG